MKALFLLVVAGLLLSSSVMAMTLVLGNASLELKEQRVKEINEFFAKVRSGEVKPIEYVHPPFGRWASEHEVTK